MLLTIELHHFCDDFLSRLRSGDRLDSRAKVKVRAGNLGTMAAGPGLVRQPRKASRLKEASMELLALSGEWALPDLDKVSEMRKSLIQGGLPASQGSGGVSGPAGW